MSEDKQNMDPPGKKVLPNGTDAKQQSANCYCIMWQRINLNDECKRGQFKSDQGFSLGPVYQPNDPAITNMKNENPALPTLMTTSTCKDLYNFVRAEGRFPSENLKMVIVANHSGENDSGAQIDDFEVQSILKRTMVPDSEAPNHYQRALPFHDTPLAPHMTLRCVGAGAGGAVSGGDRHTWDFLAIFY